MIDMYFDGDFKDGQNHEPIARILGRFNPAAPSHQDGGINQKLAEIMGYMKNERRPLLIVTRTIMMRFERLLEAYRRKCSAATGTCSGYVQSIIA